jgi:phosphonatase-like hydrolase
VISLAVLDIAGTTIDEGGAVYRVLADAVRAAGGDPTAAQLEEWMGSDKREAITGLLAAGGGVVDAETVGGAFDDFRRRLVDAYRIAPPAPFPGVAQAISLLRANGVKVVLTTGFDRGVTESLLASIGWDADVIDAVICTDDVAAGRPAPFLIFHAMESTGVADVASVLVAGDTIRDVRSGLNAGAGRVVAVRTGGVDDMTLRAAGPTDLVDSVADLPALLGSG